MSLVYIARAPWALGVAVTILLTFMSGEARAQNIDMERIFTCEDQNTLEMKQCNVGREVLLANCMACHAFVQIVIRQYDDGGWTSVLRRHKERAPHLTEEEFRALHDYLTAKFNPDREPPELPPEFLESMTDY